MSNTQYAFLMRSRVPDRTALQASIDSMGFDLKLHTEYTSFTDSGFSPCILYGIPEVGFEIAYEQAQNFPDLVGIAGSNDFCISMTWGGSMKDCACAMIVGCALVKDFGAVISYEGNPPDELDQLLPETHDTIKQALAPEAPLPLQPQSNKPWWKFW